jgi:hypothetical protein
VTEPGNENRNDVSHEPREQEEVHEVELELIELFAEHA